jgi:hypothetical protein
VAFRFGSFDKREVESYPVGRYGRGRVVTNSTVSEATLVVDVQSNASKIASKK